ncbi:tafazzin [Xylariaceae sp. FL0016]|nr:tafazzin [Xylariaceae sp. FL0016]
MPKKRHQTKYSKPPSVAPASLRLSSASQTSSEHNDRSVNELLANLRRSNNLSPSATTHSVSAATAPSVPPTIRSILQLPETPAPRPRRPQRGRDTHGRRPPPGPPPPRSWTALGVQSRHAPSSPEDEDGAGRIRYWRLPGAYMPEEGSLMDMILRRMARDWAQQRDWNRYYLYTLPSRLRTALLGYVSEIYEDGLTTGDLRVVLEGPAAEELAEYGVEKADLAEMNADAFYLDLQVAVGKSVTVRELAELLYPPQHVLTADVQDSWDAPEPTALPVALIPNLTHLSLAIDPGSASSVSWKQLLSLAGKMPQLTHLSLAGWPEPSLTPNAKYAKVTSSNGRAVQYGGTGPYSHDLDGDWSEAILILKRLSKTWYGLEYLDLTGCADWFPALMKESDGEFVIDFVDWMGDWGKITTLRLNSGYTITDETPSGQVLRFADWIDVALAVEKHIRTQRAGRGRWITVEKDALPEAAKEKVARERLRQMAGVS